MWYVRLERMGAVVEAGLIGFGFVWVAWAFAVDWLGALG